MAMNLQKTKTAKSLIYSNEQQQGIEIQMMPQNRYAAPIQHREEMDGAEQGLVQNAIMENPYAQMPPVAVPQRPTAQETAAMSKREKKLWKQRRQQQERERQEVAIRQEEEQRRRQEEEQQHRQEEEQQRREEEQRRRQEEQQRREEEQRRRQEEQQRREEEQRRRQEEEQQRREEEQRRRQEEQQRREEEEKRQEKRRILFHDSETFQAMEAMAKEKDTALLKTKMKEFLKVAAKSLVNKREELREEYSRTSDYIPMIESIRFIILEHGSTEKQKSLLINANQQMEDFIKLNEEHLLMSVATFELPDIFKEEFMALPELDKVVFEISEDFEKEHSDKLSKLKDLEKDIAKEFHVKNNHEEIGGALSAESPFAYLTKEKNIEKFHEEIEKVKIKEKCSREKAEEYFFAERRKILQEKAMEITREGSVVQGVSRKDWEAHGGASFHYTLPAGEALQVVENSNGYLYAKKVEDGLMELRPTIPKNIELSVNEEKKIHPLRRNYNLLIKCIVTQMIDENGNLYRDKESQEQMKELRKQLMRLVDMQQPDETFKFILGKSMNLLFENEEQAKFETEQLCEFFKDVAATNDKEQTFLLKKEILDNLKNFTKYLKGTEDTSYKVRIERLRKEWLKENHQEVSEEEIDKLLKQIPNASLIEQRERFMDTIKKEIEEAQKEGKEPPYDPELINKYEKALVSFHADVDAAIADLMDIRNMDIDSMDIPLSNACSANSYFYNNLGKLAGDPKGIISYSARSHTEEYPRDDLAYILANSHKFPRFKKNEDKLRELEKRCLDPEYQITADEIEFIATIAEEQYKYIYHEAACISDLQDGNILTCETFAAETTQAIVSPFIRRAAIGWYKGATKSKNVFGDTIICEGIKKYYNHDDPLPVVDDMRTELKEAFVNHKFPGDKNYGKEDLQF